MPITIRRDGLPQVAGYTGSGPCAVTDHEIRVPVAIEVAGHHADAAAVVHVAAEKVRHHARIGGGPVQQVAAVQGEDARAVAGTAADHIGEAVAIDVPHRNIGSISQPGLEVEVVGEKPRLSAERKFRAIEAGSPVAARVKVSAAPPTFVSRTKCTPVPPGPATESGESATTTPRACGSTGGGEPATVRSPSAVAMVMSGPDATTVGEVMLIGSPPTCATARLRIQRFGRAAK